MELGAAAPTFHDMRKLKHNVRNSGSVTSQSERQTARQRKLQRAQRRGRKAAAHIKDALRQHPGSLLTEDQTPEQRSGGLVAYARRALRLS